MGKHKKRKEIPVTNEYAVGWTKNKRAISVLRFEAKLNITDEAGKIIEVPWSEFFDKVSKGDNILLPSDIEQLDWVIRQFESKGATVTVLDREEFEMKRA